ncbi:MAG: hypothetical protein RLZZ502_649 [Pseudomonadota bacterium]
MKTSLLRLIALFRQAGGLDSGRGKRSGVIALGLAILSLLAVAAFHFPAYLSTPELRQKASIPVLRQLLFLAMLMSALIASVNVLARRHRWLNATALILVLLAALAGGHRVAVTDFPDNTPYLGLDFFVLDLLLSTLVFTGLEKLWPLRQKQFVFREQWQTDLIYFAANHLLVGLLLLLTNTLIHHSFGRLYQLHLGSVPQWLGSLPLPLAIFAAVLVADCAQYLIHRAFHQIPWLWRLHRIHHSIETMDWLAGSRMHLLDMLCTRVVVLGALLTLGFSKAAIDGYILIVGVHAVLNHCNVHLPFSNNRLLRFLLVTPQYHHWHHTSEQIGLDKNFAAHFPVLDLLGGTHLPAHAPALPKCYGLHADSLPKGYWAQTCSPFR